MRGDFGLFKASWLLPILTAFVVLLPHGRSFTIGFSVPFRFTRTGRACPYQRSSLAFGTCKPNFVSNNDHDCQPSLLECGENGNAVPVREVTKLTQESAEAITMRNNFLHAYLDLLGAYFAFTLKEEIPYVHLHPAAIHVLDSCYNVDNAAEKILSMCKMDYYLSLQPDDPVRVRYKLALEPVVGPSHRRRYELTKISQAVDYALLDELTIPVIEVCTLIVQLSWELSLNANVPEHHTMLMDFLTTLEERMKNYKEGAGEIELDRFKLILRFMRKHYENAEYEYDD